MNLTFWTCRRTLGAALAAAFLAVPARTQETLCAVVKLEIPQEATLERQAFDARLVLKNNLGDKPLEDLRIDIVVNNSTGTNAGQLFFVKVISMENTLSVGGTGTVDPSASAEVHWQIIPSPGSGGSNPLGVRYGVKANISYRIDADTFTLTTFESNLTVKPQPLLKLEYVLPFEVFGDEPLTDTVIEPIEPFPLGVRVTNIGYGPAKNFTIESAQPKIVENKLGLAVEFNLLGTVVSGKTVPNTLLIPFGDIPAGGVTQASWIMSTSLSGRFIEFTSTFTHAAELGGQLTSLLDSVTTYTLIRDVLVDLPGRDATPDFLVNTFTPRSEIEGLLSGGGELLPDFILESDQAAPIPVVNVPVTLSGTLGGSNTSIKVGFNEAVGAGIWVHASVPFPSGALTLVSAQRADGVFINSRNVWIDKHFNKDTKLVSYRLHLLDLTSGASEYVMNFDPTAVDKAPGQVTDLSAVAGAGGGELTLALTAPGEDDYTGSILGGRYLIQTSIYPDALFAPTSAQISLTTSTSAGEPQSLLLTGLVGNATHFIRLWTQDTGGTISLESNGTTAYVLPNPPNELVITDVSSITAHAAWQTGNNSFPIEYRVYAATSADGVAVSASPYSDSFSREFDFAGLAPSTTYTVFGEARNPDTGVMSPRATLGQFMTSPSPDTTPPVTSLQVNGVTISTAALVVTSTDTLGFVATDSESGVARTLYALDGGTETVYVSTFSLAYGTYTLTYRSEDMAGNYEALQASSITSIAAMYFAASGDGAATVSSPRADATITAVSTDTAASAYEVAVSSQGLVPATSSYYELLPSSVVFDPPALLSLSFSPVALDTATAAIYRFDGVAWDSAPVTGQQITDIGGGLLEISGTVQSASLYAVFALPPTLVSIEVTPSTASIAMGTTAQFEATGTFTDASTRTITVDVAWTTDVSSTVAVSTSGLATGLLEGTALIIASSGTITAQAVLTVTPATLVSLEVIPSTASIAMGTTIQFEATGTFTDASTRTLTGEVVWSTDVSSTVAVSTTGAATGLLEGTAAIIASSGAVTAQAVLTVTPATLVSLEVTPSTASIAMGTTIQFEATGTFTDASTRTLTGEVAWSTDVSSTVSVSTTGAATGLLEGTAAIIASSGAVTAQAVLTVTPATLVSLEVTPSTASIAMGTTTQFEATGTFTDASTRTLTGELAWATDASSVATVASGLAIGVGEGTALVIASSGAVTAQADLTVTPATLVSIVVTPPSTSISAGLTAQFEATGTFTDASTRTLTGEVAWTTDLSTVASVDVSGLATGLIEGTAQVSASSGTISAFAELTVTAPTLVSIHVAPSSATIAAGLTTQFEAAGTFTDGSTRTLTGEVDWSTDLSSVATVNAAGLATGVDEGAALVIASSGTITAQAVLTVNPATLVSIEVTPPSASIAAGLTAQFEAAGTFTDGSTRTLTGEVAWSTDVSSVAAISASGLAAGVGEGTALVIASSGTITAQAVLTVNAATLVSIEVTPPSISIAAGLTAQFEAAGTFTDGSTRTLTGEVAWSTNLSSVATVSATGLATAVGEGSALVIASSGTITAQTVLTVTPATLVSLAVAPPSASIAAGLTAQFEAAGTFTDGSTRTLTGEVAWSTDASSVATVSVSGLATGVGEGSALVIASSGPITAQAVLTVTPATLVSIEVTPPSASIAAGLTAQFEAAGTFTDSSTRTLTGEVAWSTDASSVATVNAAGLATGVGEGTALVIASSGSVTAQAVLTVTPATLVSIEVAPPSASIAAGLTAQFEAAGTFTDGSTRTLTGEVAWSTDASSVATVNAAGLATGIGEGTALVIASSGTITGQAVLTVTPATLVSITVTPTSASIAAGLTTKFEAMGTFTNASTRTLTGEVAWSTDASSVATVSSAGLATGVGEGTALVIVSSGAITAQAILTVTPATLVSIAVTPPSASIAAGLTAQFEAAGTFTDGSTRTMTGEVAWSTDASSVATVNAAGLATGLGEGSALVIASSGTITAQAVLTVTPATLVSIAVAPPSASIAAGLTAQFEAAGTFTDGSTRTLTGEVVWSTDASSVATVNAAGLATGVGEGAALIIASSGTITAQAVLTVAPPTLVSIAVTPASALVATGLTAQFEAAGTFTDASTRTLTGEVSWSTDASSVATVNTGLATGISEGTALVIASSGTITAQAVLTVTPPTLVSITVTPASASIAAGLTAQFEAAGTFTDGSTRTLTGEIAWSTDASSVATVNAAGLATGVGEGAALVIASSGTITAQAVLTVNPATLVSISVTPPSASIATGLTTQFEAGGTFTDGSTRTLTGEVAWSTDASTVATVSASGLATGVGEGVALVTASSGSVTAQAVLTVTPATLASIAVTPPTASIPAGTEAQFEASGTFTDASTRTLTGEVAWSTDPSTVATINAAGLAAGAGEGTALVFASSGAITGQASLTVSATYFTTASADGAATLSSSRADMTITAVSPGSVASAESAAAGQGLVATMPSYYELQPSPVAFEPAALLSFTFDPAAVDTHTISIYRYNDPQWSTSPIAGQTIEILGPTLARASGYLSSASLYAVFYLPSVPPLTSIAVTPVSATILAGTAAQFEAAGTFADGSTRTLTGEVSWSTDVSSVATVNSSGLATGVGGGAARVIASSGAITGFASLTVTLGPLTLASITPESAATGQTVPAALTGTGFDAATALTLERADALNGTWAAAGSFAQGRYVGTLTKLGDGRVLLAGGVGGPTAADIYNPATGAWTAAPALNQGRDQHAAVALADGRVLVSGGYASGSPVNSAEIYNPALNTWTTVASMNAVRAWHQMTLLADGRVLAAGGTNGPGYLSSTEIYDPVANTWTPAASMSVGHSGAAMATLSGGKILVAGGFGGNLTGEVYDPTTNAWTTATGALQASGYYLQAVRLSNGKVVIAGDPGGTTDLYDPATNALTAAAPLGTARYVHAMARVDGTALVIGGENSTALASTEFYDAAAGIWRPGPALTAPRTWLRGAVLDDGRVLVAGGLASVGGTRLNTAELLGEPAAVIAATGEAAADSQHLTGTLVLSGATTGYWDVVVRRTDGKSARLDGGFQISTAPAQTDFDAPVVTLSFSTPAYFSAGGLVTIGTHSLISLQAVDPSSSSPASGVAQILYAVDATTPNVTYTAPFTLAAGAHTVYFSATDVAGNASEISSAALSAAESPFVGVFSPSSGAIGIAYSMAGFGFGTYGGANTQVRFGPSTSPVSVWNDASIVGTVPGLSTGAHAVTLERLWGSTLTISAAGTYTVTPLVPTLSVATGPIGLPFTLTGPGFGTFLGANSRVLFAGATAPISVWNDATISGTIPGVADGTTTMVVERQTADGFTARSEPLPFTVTLPSVTAVSPSSAPVGGGFALTGWSFGNYLGTNTQVLIGGATTPVSVWNDATIVGTVPGALLPGEHELVVERRTADGFSARSASVPFTVVGLWIEAISPSTGAIGIPFTVTGTGFGSYLGANSRVMFGVSTAAVSVWTDGSISGTIPTLATGAYAVTVERQQGADVSVSNVSTFTVISPEIASVAPSSGPIGTVFTLSGTGFGPFAGANTFLLLGGATTPITVWNDTTITATVPGSLTQGVHELVAVRRNADGGLSVSNTAYFEVTALSIASVSPSTGAIGIPFTINGSEFGVFLGANSRVRFGVSTAAVSVWNNTTISGTVPTLATGAYAVTVERQQGEDVSVSNAFTFTVISPEIASVTPSSGPIGTVFTLSGAGFGPFSGENTFLLLGGATTPISVWNDSTITATVPGGLTPGVKELTAVRRNTDGGLSASNTTYFEVTGMSIASINPSTGPIGIPFTIKGSQFGVFLGANSRVRFGVSTAAVSVWNDTTISGTLPALSTGAHAVVIERQQGTDVTFSEPSSFTVTELAVGAMTPSSGPIGVAFTITGEHFGPFAGTNTRLLLGGTTVAVSVWNDTTITGTVPDLAAGSQPLWLERTAGTGVQSSATTYFLVTTPEITSMVPSSAPIGAPFTLNGTSFGTYGGANTRVKFNGVVAPVSIWNDVQIVGTVPGAVSTGPAVLVVERAAGAGVSSSVEQAFEVLRPVISTVSPSYGPAGTVVSLTGHGFGPYAGTATQLLVGGTTVSVSVWNDATIRWTVTAAFSNGDYPLVVRRSPVGGTVDSEPASFTVGTGYGGASFGFSEPLSLAAQPDINFEGGLNLPVDEGGRVETASKAAVDVPANALEVDTEITLKRLRPDGLRTEAAGEEKKRAAGEAIEFGPAGTLFKTPVTIELPYDPALAGDETLLAVHYYDPLRRAWEELPSVVDRVRRVVRAQTAHFSIYQPMSALAPQTAAQDEFFFRDQYAFPNPSRGGAVTFRIQPGLADTIELRVYDLSGRRVHSSTDFTFRGALDDLNGKGAQNTYDHVWGVSGVGSGVYHYVIKASRAGSSPIVKKGKVGVIK